MMPSKDGVEVNLGIRWFISDTEGIGGRIRARVEDFKVSEVCSSKLLENLRRRPREARGSLLLIKRSEVDTFAAVRGLARALGLTPQKVKIFGIKDKHAVVRQYAYVERIVSGRGSLGRIAYEVVGYVKERPGAREAIGNFFEVVVRDVERPRGDLLSRISAEISAKGCPNYFGYQRFGTRRPITHLVGRLIVLGNYEEAVWTYVGLPSPREGEEKFKLRKEIFERRDPREALAALPRALLYERAMMRRLLEKPADYLGALRRLPLRLRKLLVMAYQAYLFNKVLSLRIEQGLSINEPLAGDYVLLNGKIARWDGQRGRATLLLQTVGYTYRRPEGIQGEIDVAVMKEEGVTPRMFYKRDAPEFSMPSFFRPASVLPDNLTYEVYPEERVVKFSFALPRGSFATVLLREFLKPCDVIRAGF